MNQLFNSRLRRGAKIFSGISLGGLLVAIGGTFISAHDLVSIITKSAVVGGGSSTFVVGIASAYSAARADKKLDDITEDLLQKRKRIIRRMALFNGYSTDIERGRFAVAEVYLCDTTTSEIMNLAENYLSSKGLSLARSGASLVASGRIKLGLLRDPYMLGVSIVPYEKGNLVHMRSMRAYFSRDTIVPGLITELTNKSAAPTY